jgi:hypothetical protein
VAADGRAEGIDQLPEGERLRADRVEHDGVGACAEGDAQPGKVIDVDRTHPVGAEPAHREDRHVTQQPGNVVDQHAVAAEQDRRAGDSVRDAELAEDLLDLGLAAEVRIRESSGGW